MCVHVFCAFDLPDETQVWVDREPAHIFVYADSSLVAASGALTAAGVDEVNRALAGIPGAPSLESAKSCR